MKFKLQIMILGIIISGTMAMAQPRFQAGLNFNLATPQGEFKENVDNVGFGLSGQFGYVFPESPFIIGGNLGFLIYGSDTREEPFSTTIPDVFVDVTTTNSILNAHILLRIQPQQGTLRPYLDGLFGFNYLSTTTEIKDQYDYDDNVASSTNQDDFTSSYGGGGGLMLKVYEGEAENGGNFEVLIDFGVRFLKGGEAEYLKEGSITHNNGKVHYDLSRSKTDLRTFRLGATVNF